MNILILGNGQLGQMLGRAAIHYGHACLLVDTKTDQVMPVAAYEPLPMDIAAATEWADVVSWEHEQLAPAHVAICKAKFLSPTDNILALTDRELEKSLCDELALATSPWQAFKTRDELQACLQQTQNAVVIKAAQGGYDGRSQWRHNPQADSNIASELLQQAGAQRGIVEDMIDFTCEVSLVGARNAQGDICCFPLVENVHRQGILSHTLAGLTELPEHLQAQAEDFFKRLTDHLQYVGTLAIEFFVVGEASSARLLVNEVAPRVHNSGHWTLTGSSCDQFDLHIRAITGMPFPAALNTQATVMLNVIGVSQIAEHLWPSDADPYWYGKDARPGRKVGHINWRTTSRGEALAFVDREQPQAQQLAD
ncbi:phosphoribosylaminoimidazole carboxylase [Aliidiomarina sedimenti]|uniref:Phosphoribosylaminoimidazole carboxylase n=1 Tax=Aliidiomarina sedimenti TaxID=1933879 RepID=A0ABY0C0D1_9GAMM|nr:ATP-grasp domain-containing protein [Aliidiomarina sedimenti]RUO30771.1 phosphoribosylaminoimidazole carboxylase [Aliidiomarina sedimenti]